MFAAIARRYDLNNRLHSLGRDQAWRRRAVRMAQVKQTDAVLDVACGTGDLAEAFASGAGDVSPASVVGLDFTKPMIEIAQEKAQRLKRCSGVPTPRYMVGDAMDLPFESKSFDIVSIAFGIRNVQDPKQVLREFFRVLRPRGRVVILEFSEPRNPAFRWLSRLYCRKIMPRTASLLAGDRSGAYFYLPQSVSTFLDREALIQMMQEAGFTRIEQKPMTWGISVGYVGTVSE